MRIKRVFQRWKRKLGSKERWPKKGMRKRMGKWGD